LSNPSRQAGSVGGRKEAGISDSGMGGGCLRIFLEGELYCIGLKWEGWGGVGAGYLGGWGGGRKEKRKKKKKKM